MIHQIAPIPQVKSPVTPINKDFAKARLIQARINGRVIDAAEIDHGYLWSPLTSGPYLVPVLHWLD